MKRFPAVIAAACATLLLFAALAGCGGSGQVDQAKQMLRDAGAQFSQAQGLDGVISKQGEAIRNDLLSAKEVSDQTINELKTAEARTEKEMGLARKSYDDVAALSGAGNYAEYARIMSGAAETGVTYAKKKLEYVLVFVNAARNPTTVDPTALDQQIASLEKEITGLRDKIRATVQDAADFAGEKKLF